MSDPRFVHEAFPVDGAPSSDMRAALPIPHMGGDNIKWYEKRDEVHMPVVPSWRPNVRIGIYLVFAGNTESVARSLAIQHYEKHRSKAIVRLFQ